MERIKSLYSEVKSIFLTCFFEMTLQIKKFIIFSSITIVAIILNSYLPYILIPQLQVPNTQVYFYQSGLNTFYLIIIFAVCFFFSGIICSEFRDKTGIIIFPKINKYKLIIGKYLGNLTLVTGVICIYYLSLALIGYNFYGEPISYRLFFSFGFALLYALALSSFITFFSSFMKSAKGTIVITIILLLFVLNIVDALVMVIRIEFEPIFSLNYVRNIITFILDPDFSTMDRYMEYTIGDFTIRTWLTPSIQGAIIAFLMYMTIFFLFASLLFKRRQL